MGREAADADGRYPDIGAQRLNSAAAEGGRLE